MNKKSALNHKMALELTTPFSNGVLQVHLTVVRYTGNLFGVVLDFGD